MSHGRSFNRYHRWLAKQARRRIRQFFDKTEPKDVMLVKYKQQKDLLFGT